MEEILRDMRHTTHVFAMVLPVVVARAILRDGTPGVIHHVAGGGVGTIVVDIVYAVVVGISHFLFASVQPVGETLTHPIDTRVAIAGVERNVTIRAGIPRSACAVVTPAGEILTYAMVARVGIAGVLRFDRRHEGGSQHAKTQQHGHAQGHAQRCPWE